MRLTDLAVILALMPLASFDAGGLEGSAASFAREHDYVLVSAMPPVEGRMVSQRSGHDRDSGLSFRTGIYHQAGRDFTLSTHVTHLACGTLPAETNGPPLIMAIRVLPLQIRSYRQALMRDRFVEVYVRDRDGIQLHENLDRRDMAELTRKFQPLCTLI